MSDLISKQRAIETICLAICEESKPCDWECTEITILKKLPSAEKRGRWTECDHEVWGGYTSAYRCSECGKGYHTVHRGFTTERWNYCPNCGAKMEDKE